MCLEVITLAHCAPQNPPALSFTCGKLHMVAGSRSVCSRARGPCVCFFGTCGTVERDVGTTAVDFTDLTKIRCAHCTTREDAVGDRRKGREIIESALLQRPALSLDDDQAYPKHYATLKELWGGKPTCPFHALAEPARPSIELKAQDVIDPRLEKSTLENITATPVADRNTINNMAGPPVSEPRDSDIVDTIMENVSFLAGSNIDGGEPVLPRTEITNGLETDVGIKSSRWAGNSSNNVTPQPMTRPSRLAQPSRRVPEVKDNSKLRDATRKLAGAKSFLGKLSI